MKRNRRLFTALTAASLVAGFGFGLAPAKAQAQSATTSTSSDSQATTETQQRLQDLEKEVALLQKEIVALKDSDTPSMKTASYTLPSANAAVTSAPAPAAPQTPAVTLAGLLGSTTISGFVDGYYGYNSNHPIDNTSGQRFFDGQTNGFGFNMAELIVDKAPDATTSESRMGYHIAAAYGQAAAAINCSDIGNFLATAPSNECSNFYLKEAYGSYLAPIGKGLTISVGKFVTPIGAEVIESNANWNYSRSLLFYNAIPYFHFGANAKYVWNPKWTTTLYLVNGWNNSVINHDFGRGNSSGLTYGASVAYTPNMKWSVIENYFAGPVTDQYDEFDKTINDYKQLSDTVISYTPNSKWAFMVNGDYGFGPRNWNCGGSEGTTCVKVGPQATWWGAAGYAKYNFNMKSNFAVRYEYYGDPQGYTIFDVGDINDTKGHAQEFTGTYSYNVTNNFLVRGEYRYDFASQPFFTRGDNFFSRKEQHTATLGFVYSFSSMNAK